MTHRLTVGEKVKVLIYRLHVLDGEQTYLRENSAMMGSDVSIFKRRSIAMQIQKEKIITPMSSSLAGER